MWKDAVANGMSREHTGHWVKADPSDVLLLLLAAIPHGKGGDQRPVRPRGLCARGRSVLRPLQASLPDEFGEPF